MKHADPYSELKSARMRSYVSKPSTRPTAANAKSWSQSLACATLYKSAMQNGGKRWSRDMSLAPLEVAMNRTSLPQTEDSRVNAPSPSDTVTATRVLEYSPLDILDGNVVDGPLDLLGCEALADSDSLATDVLGNGCCAVKTKEKGSLELLLCALNLGGGGVHRHTLPFLENEVGEVIEVHEVLRDRVDTPKTSVGVRGGEGHVGVGEVVGRDDGAKLGAKEGRGTERAVPVAEDGLHDEHCPVVGALPSDTLDSDSKVAGAHGVVTDTDLRTDELGRLVARLAKGDGVGGDGEVGKVLGCELDEGLVGDGTSTNECHAVGGVVLGNVARQVGLVDGVDSLLGAENGVAESLALESNGVEVVEDNLLELLVDLLLLTENDIALALDGGLLKLGVLENVGDDVDDGRDILVECLGVVNGLLTRSVGVQVGAEVLNLELELLLGAGLGTLECKVLSSAKF